MDIGLFALLSAAFAGLLVAFFAKQSEKHDLENV